MSIMNGIFAADSRDDQSASLAATTSTAEIVFGAGSIIVLNSTGDMHIKFGNSGMTAASATNFRLPGGIMAEYIFGQNADRIRLYNPGASSITYWIQILSTN